MAAAVVPIIQLIASLAPTVTNLILSFRHPDGTTTVAVLLSDAEAANVMNAQNIAQFQALLGTAVPKTAPASS